MKPNPIRFSMRFKSELIIENIFHPRDSSKGSSTMQILNLKRLNHPATHVWRLMILAVAPKTCAKSDRNGGIWVHVTIERSNVRSMKVQRCAYRSVTHTDTRPIVPPIHAAESLYLARLNRLKVLPNGKLNEVYSHNSTCYRLEMCQKNQNTSNNPQRHFVDPQC